MNQPIKRDYPLGHSLVCVISIFLAFPELFFAGFSDVLSSMMKRETGSKTLRSERVLSRGDPNFNGRVKSFISQEYQNQIVKEKCQFCKMKKSLQSVKCKICSGISSGYFGLEN